MILDGGHKEFSLKEALRRQNALKLSATPVSSKIMKLLVILGDPQGIDKESRDNLAGVLEEHTG